MKNTLFRFFTLSLFFISGCSAVSGKVITLEGEMYSGVREQFDCKTGKIRYHKDDIYKLDNMQLRISEALVPGITSNFSDPSNYYEYFNQIGGDRFGDQRFNEVNTLCAD